MRCVLLGVPLLEGAPWFPALLCPLLLPKGTDPATLSCNPELRAPGLGKFWVWSWGRGRIWSRIVGGAGEEVQGS